MEFHAPVKNPMNQEGQVSKLGYLWTDSPGMWEGDTGPEPPGQGRLLDGTVKPVLGFDLEIDRSREGHREVVTG